MQNYTFLYIFSQVFFFLHSNQLSNGTHIHHTGSAQGEETAQFESRELIEGFQEVGGLLGTKMNEIWLQKKKRQVICNLINNLKMLLPGCNLC